MANITWEKASWEKTTGQSEAGSVVIRLIVKRRNVTAGYCFGKRIVHRSTTRLFYVSVCPAGGEWKTFPARVISLAEAKEMASIALGLKNAARV